jgi:hypothetical protein
MVFAALSACPVPPWSDGTPMERLAAGRTMAKPQKKRVSKFDEQSHYVIENKRSEKRTKPNKAKFGGWENRLRGESNTEL